MIDLKEIYLFRSTCHGRFLLAPKQERCVTRLKTAATETWYFACFFFSFRGVLRGGNSKDDLNLCKNLEEFELLLRS